MTRARLESLLHPHNWEIRTSVPCGIVSRGVLFTHAYWVICHKAQRSAARKDDLLPLLSLDPNIQVYKHSFNAKSFYVRIVPTNSITP